VARLIGRPEAFRAVRLRVVFRVAFARFFAVFLVTRPGLLALFGAGVAALAAAGLAAVDFAAVDFAAVPCALAADAAFAGFDGAVGAAAGFGAAPGFAAVTGFAAAARGSSCTANTLPWGSFNMATQLPPGTSIGPLTSRPPADLAVEAARLESATCT
jgi:hypothetical protein